MNVLIKSPLVTGGIAANLSFLAHPLKLWKSAPFIRKELCDYDIII